MDLYGLQSKYAKGVDQVDHSSGAEFEFFDRDWFVQRG